MLALLIVAQALAVVAFVYSCFQLYHVAAPLWLIPRGDYKRARRSYEITLRSLFRWVPGVRNTCTYGVASCLAGEGKMEESLSALRELPFESLPPALRFAVDTNAATILLHSGREHAEVELRLNRAFEIHGSPDLLFARALAQLALGRPEDAEKSYGQATTMSSGGSTLVSATTVVVRTEQIVNARTALYRGWYLLLTDRKDESRPFLEEATQSPTAIGKLAQRLLEQAGPAPSREEDRPSLPPMTIPNE